MTVTDYKNKVIALFQSGKASDACWQEMATQVLYSSEADEANVPGIDEAVGVLDVDNLK